MVYPQQKWSQKQKTVEMFSIIPPPNKWGSRASRSGEYKPRRGSAGFPAPGFLRHEVTLKLESKKEIFIAHSGLEILRYNSLIWFPAKTMQNIIAAWPTVRGTLSCVEFSEGCLRMVLYKPQKGFFKNNLDPTVYLPYHTWKILNTCLVRYICWIQGSVLKLHGKF